MKRLWWDQQSEYWELPFYAEMGIFMPFPQDRGNELAAREQLWAVREDLTDSEYLEKGDDSLQRD